MLGICYLASIFKLTFSFELSILPKYSTTNTVIELINTQRYIILSCTLKNERCVTIVSQIIWHKIDISQRLVSTMVAEIEAVRLDKWLWAARFYKTRSIARNMVDGGKVHYNGQRSKPSKTVELGAIITLRQGHEEKTVVIEKISDQRRGAPEAQTLYSETESSLAKREENATQRRLHAHNPSPDRRPDKKQRRDIIKFKHQ